MTAGGPSRSPAALWWHLHPLTFLGAEPDALPEGSPVVHRLPRLERWLDHAVALGCDGLLLGPVFASSSHGYDTVSYDVLDPRLGDADDLAHLVAAAREAMGRAHAPYSRFHVGAALRAEDGSIHAGANVENSAYPQGQCAEASAIGVLVAAGGTRVLEAAVIADSPEVCVPCGGCRQRLREFMPLDGTIHLCSAGGERRTATLEELLPLSFGPEFLPA